MLKRLLPLRQSGDTIVEVLIVLAIVGLALGISYATANRSLQTVQQSEEHAQALQLVQGQLEQLKSTLGDSTTADYASIQSYTGKTPPVQYKAFCFTGAGALALSSDPLCQQDSQQYVLTITCGSNASPCKDVYIAKASWDSIKANGKDTVSLAYKVYAQ